MAKKRNPKAKKQQALQAAQEAPPAQAAFRRSNGQFQKGFSGSISSDAARARRQLNASTIQGMQWAFDKHGRKAIEKVATSQPAIFLKMLVLLVPRELEITQSSGTKGMSDEQLDVMVATLEGYLARRSGDMAKVIEAVPSPAETPDKSEG